MKTVTTTLKNNVYTIKLNRPDTHNAFDSEMIEELASVFRTIPKESRAILLRGEGKSFCAGADLNWMKSMAGFSFEENEKDSAQLRTMFETIAQVSQPIVGHIHGSVFGGGLGLVAVCDIVAARRETKFCFSEVKLGLVPAVISPFVLNKARHHLARQMMLTAQVFNEDKALEMGLVHMVGTDEEVEDFVTSQLDFIVSNGPEAVCATKKLIHYISSHSPSDVQKETVRVIAERRVSQEGQEGIRAFFEKRKPNWKN